MRAGSEAERDDHVGPFEQRMSAVGDQCVRPGSRSVPSRPWQREYGTPVLERVLRGDPRPAARGRFDDDDDIRERRH